MGEVEVDETYIGGKARNMHHDKRAKLMQNEGAFRKAVVVGMLERKGEVRTPLFCELLLKSYWGKSVREHVVPGSHLITDEAAGYTKVGREYAHKVINHAETYVKGTVHTNSIENYWSLLKRGIKGTYISVEPFHLFRWASWMSNRSDSILGRITTRGYVGLVFHHWEACTSIAN